jgi:hypothetical protein
MSYRQQRITYYRARKTRFFATLRMTVRKLVILNEVKDLLFCSAIQDWILAG